MAVIAGRYLMGQHLGEGAYGAVCKAIDIKQDRRRVAVKTLDLTMLPPGETKASWTMDAVQLEVSLMQRLDHQNVLRVLDFIKGDSIFWLVTELCEGPDLQVLLEARGALLFDEAAALLAQCAKALQELHKHGIVHRDVKPAVGCPRTQTLHRCQSLLASCRCTDLRLAPYPCMTRRMWSSSRRCRTCAPRRSQIAPSSSSTSVWRGCSRSRATRARVLNTCQSAHSLVICSAASRVPPHRATVPKTPHATARRQTTRATAPLPTRRATGLRHMA